MLLALALITLCLRSLVDASGPAFLHPLSLPLSVRGDYTSISSYVSSIIPATGCPSPGQLLYEESSGVLYVGCKGAQPVAISTTLSTTTGMFGNWSALTTQLRTYSIGKLPSSSLLYISNFYDVTDVVNITTRPSPPFPYQPLLPGRPATDRSSLQMIFVPANDGHTLFALSYYGNLTGIVDGRVGPQLLVSSAGLLLGGAMDAAHGVLYVTSSGYSPVYVVDVNARTIALATIDPRCSMLGGVYVSSQHRLLALSCVPTGSQSVSDAVVQVYTIGSTANQLTLLADPGARRSDCDYALAITMIESSSWLIVGCSGNGALLSQDGDVTPLVTFTECPGCGSVVYDPALGNVFLSCSNAPLLVSGTTVSAVLSTPLCSVQINLQFIYSTGEFLLLCYPHVIGDATVVAVLPGGSARPITDTSVCVVPYSSYVDEVTSSVFVRCDTGAVVVPLHASSTAPSSTRLLDCSNVGSFMMAASNRTLYVACLPTGSNSVVYAIDMTSHLVRPFVTSAVCATSKRLYVFSNALYVACSCASGASCNVLIRVSLHDVSSTPTVTPLLTSADCGDVHDMYTAPNGVTTVACYSPGTVRNLGGLLTVSASGVVSSLLQPSQVH